jgi:Tfp pilus assembly PilM family ATPase/outer membrane murein-binding lipoprotein Lpp
LPRYLAIDADGHGLTVAAGSVRGGTAHVEQAFAWPETAPPLSPATAAPLGRRLAELLKEAGVAPAPVLFAVGRDRIILKEIKHPPSPPQDEPAVVRFQAMKELTESPDDGVLDYMPLGSDAGGERRSLVAFVNKDVFNAVKAACDAAGLKLAAVTPRPFATTAAAGRAVATGAVPVPDAVDAAVAVVTLNDSSGEFSVIKNGAVRFSRHVSPMAMTNEATLVAELRRNLSVYSAQSLGDSIQAIYLAEGETGLGGWSGRLGATLPVPVYPFDPLAGTPVADRVPPKQRSRFAGVVGLLAGQSRVGPTPINFVQPRQPRAEVNPNRNRIVVGALLGLLTLAGLAFRSYALLQSAAAKTANLQAQVQSLESDLKLREPDVKRLAAAEEFDKRGIPWLDEKYDLAVLFPDISKMKLMSYVVSALPPPVSKDKQKPAAPTGSRLTASPPVAKMRLTIAADNGTLPEELVRALARESRYYSGVRSTIGPLLPGGSARSPVQQFFIDANISRRSPEEYTSRLRVTLPKPEVEPEKPAAAPDPNPLGLPGGFGPDGGNAP